jgi:hypothetical protein
VRSKVPSLAVFVFVALAATVPKGQAEVVRPHLSPTLESLHHGLEQVIEELDVSPIQMFKIRRILLEELSQLDHDSLNNNLSPEQSRRQELAIQVEGRRQIDSILSPSQRQQLEEMLRRRQFESSEGLTTVRIKE